MTRSVEAHLRWLNEEGGRAAPPPGPVYSTVARFRERSSDAWVRDACSLVITYVDPPSTSIPSRVLVRFLSDGPADYLRSGGEFQLTEGSKVVATGQVTQLYDES
jgi:hypothetical protein